MASKPRVPRRVWVVEIEREVGWIGWSTHWTEGPARLVCSRLATSARVVEYVPAPARKPRKRKVK